MPNSLSIEQGRLYRIMDFCRVVQIFERKELHFSHPSNWDDPDEKRVQHPQSHALFAQCWCKIGISDAMWRIYSQNHMGVRISTTAKKLEAAVKNQIKPLGYKWLGKDVVYQPQSEMRATVKEITSELRHKFSVKRSADLLYYKREAFDHEHEWRATIYCPDADPSIVPRSIPVKIDPHELINNILFDPRAPDELVNAFTHYFQDVLGFKKKIGRSVLYKIPTPITIPKE